MGFGVWGNTAPIAGAVVASGVFVATGQNKIIQHLEGGVIREIDVREGDIVEPGQLLVELDETAPRAELRRLFLRRIRLTAIDARLQAEMREDAGDHVSRTMSATSAGHAGGEGDPRKPADHLRGAPEQREQRDRGHQGEASTR